MAIPSTVADLEHERSAHARVLCRHHAAPLLAMASIMLDDVDTAGEIVANTLAAACRPIRHPQPASARVRIELARSVYWRCVGQIATIERFGLPIRSHRQDDVGSDPGLGSLSVRHRAVIALTLFGGHDLQQATITLQMPTPQVVRHMREAIRYGTTASRSPAPA